MSKLLDEMENKLTAIEQLEHMMRSCNFQIVSCECTEGMLIYFERRRKTFVIQDAHDDIHDCGNLESAIQKFAELTEH